MTQHVCSCHCGSNLFYKHLHAESCALSRHGDEAPCKTVRDYDDMREREYPEQDLERQVADLTAKLEAKDAEIRDMRKSIDTAAKGIVRLTKDAALEFAKAAIGDAIYLEEGLDGETGQRVQRLIVEALARGTFDAPGEIADFLTRRERVTQDQITNLTAQLDAAEERLSAMEQDRDKWRAMCNTFQVQRDKLTQQLEYTKELADKWFQDWENEHDNVDALQAKLEEAQARAQRPPEPHESVCHACDGSGWVSS